MNEDQAHVRRSLRWLIRPALAAAVLLTIYGNLAQAQPSVGGWVSHGWAPTLYLVLVEILVRRAVGGRWLWPVVVGFVVLAVVAGIVSFTSLERAAVRWGWEPSEAWMFPVIVDLTAVLLTMASVGAGARIRELAGTAEALTGPAVQPVSPAVALTGPADDRPEPEDRPAEQPAGPVKAEPAAGRRRPDLTARILADYPDEIPAAAELARAYGVARSTAGDNRRKAVKVRQAEAAPV